MKTVGRLVEDARRQYKQDRDPREPIFEFKRRTLVQRSRALFHMVSLLSSIVTCPRRREKVFLTCRAMVPLSCLGNMGE